MIFSKRKKFFLVSVLLAWGFLVVLFTPFYYRYLSIAILAILSYPLSAWSLYEDLDGVEWILNLILPVLYLPALALFSFLLPGSIWLRALIFLVALLGQYGVLLSVNIFSVAVIRTIQLLRAAQAIGFLFTILIAFFLFNTLFSFKPVSYLAALIAGLISFPLALQSLWAVRLDKKILKKLVFLSFCISFLLFELSMMISLWPVNILIASLFLVACLYIFLSLMQYRLNERLFAKTVFEYIRLAVLIFIVTFLAAHWG